MLKLVTFFVLMIMIISIYWYQVSFGSKLEKFELMIERGLSSVDLVEDKLYPLVEASQTRDEIRKYAVELAYDFLAKKGGRTLYREIDRFMWFSVSKIHFSDEKIFGLWLDCVISGCEKGVSEAAKKYFRKNLNELTELELANLVAMVEKREKYYPGTESGKRRAKEILEQSKI